MYMCVHLYMYVWLLLSPKRAFLGIVWLRMLMLRRRRSRGQAYKYVCRNMHACIYMHVCICTCMYACMICVCVYCCKIDCMHVYVFAHALSRVYARISMYACMYSYTYVCTHSHVYMYARIRTSTCTFMYVCSCYVCVHRLLCLYVLFLR